MQDDRAGAATHRSQADGDRSPLRCARATPSGRPFAAGGIGSSKPLLRPRRYMVCSSGDMASGFGAVSGEFTREMFNRPGIRLGRGMSCLGGLGYAPETALQHLVYS